MINCYCGNVLLVGKLPIKDVKHRCKGSPSLIFSSFSLSLSSCIPELLFLLNLIHKKLQVLISEPLYRKS